MHPNMRLPLLTTVALAHVLASVAGLSTTQQHAGRCQNPPVTRQQIRQVARLPQLRAVSEDNEMECDPCARFEPEDNVDLDRREAFFSMVGMAWAAGVLPAALLDAPQPANAVYGLDAKIELPNPYQSLSDRQNKQCLVESLGTRECMVYEDSANKLYQGANGKLLLDRVEAASQALSQQVPLLVEAKKWSQVTGVLTGPMGELLRNMNQLVELSENKDLAKSNVNLVKTDLYAMSAAVDRKQGEAVLKSQAAAMGHLVDFVTSL
jgi:hypothetical protein